MLFSKLKLLKLFEIRVGWCNAKGGDNNGQMFLNFPKSTKKV